MPGRSVTAVNLQDSEEEDHGYDAGTSSSSYGTDAPGRRQKHAKGVVLDDGTVLVRFWLALC